MLDKETIEAYKEAGVKWYYPDDNIRNNHSKVYRFYGAEKVYTIIGSVNLTAPAWIGHQSRPKQIYNIESAVLYIESDTNPFHLFKKEIKDEPLKFLQPEVSEENWHERIEIPEISFTVNWLDKTLSWKSKAKNDCRLYLTDSQVFPLGWIRHHFARRFKGGRGNT